MSTVKELLWGLVVIESQTESDRQDALAQIESSKKGFLRNHHPLQEKRWMIKMAYGDFSLDANSVKQANLRRRIVGFGFWTRNQGSFNSPDDFGEMLRSYSSGS